MTQWYVVNYSTSQMTPKAFLTIIEKYIEGISSSSENAYIEKWYESIQEVDAASVFNIDTIGGEMYLKIREKLLPAKQQKLFRVHKLYKVAAVLIVAICGAWVYSYFANTDKPQPITLMPGSAKAILKLANGSTILLDSSYSGNLAFDGGAKISKLSDGAIAYQAIKGAQVEPTYNEMEIPAGGRYTLKLPDGSVIWLNSVSSIRFPTRFVGNVRKVFLKGEAFFEVTHNKAKPFIVEVAGKQQTTVLGTSFNISAYEDDPVAITTLISGSVKINAAIGSAYMVLQPGQQSITNTIGNIKAKNNVNIEQVTAWKNGYFLFDRTDISEIMKQVARWYNANIEIDPKLKGQTYSGKIPKGESIVKFLNILETTNMVKYNIYGNKVKIYSKK